MNERAEPVLTGSNVDDFVEGFNEDNAESRGANVVDVPTNLGSADRPISPTFYTMLLFHRAFCEYTFNDNFDFLKRNDIYFGSGTFGQLSRFMPVQIYVMRKQLDELKDGGWKERDEFKPYIEALEGIPEKSSNNNEADREFFVNMSNKFISMYELSLNDHLLERWRSEKLVWYALGGDENVAKEMAKWLVDYKNNGGGVEMNAAGEEVNTTSTYDGFTPGEIDLCKQHNTPTSEVVKVKLDKCMEYLTMGQDRELIINEGFIGKHWDDIVALAMAPNTVRLFDYEHEGKTCCLCYTFSYTSLIHHVHLLSTTHKMPRRKQSTRLHGTDTTTMACWRVYGNKLQSIPIINNVVRIMFRWLH
jgi:hypothetical protein